jgi:2-polyprenyl-3-methyl-5-hydroxy-6-metoxy-1,4-benzoquinol methylase/DNA-binding transcriptional ArsR family regulator
MPIQPNFLERTAFYALNQAPAVMLDLAGALSYQAVSAAVRLELFDALAEQPMTAAELARRLQSQPRGIEALLQALEATGYVEARDGYYANSAMTRKWLVEDDGFDGPAIMRFWDDALKTLWPNASEVIRSGERPVGIYDWVESDPIRNHSFQQSLVMPALSVGPEIARKLALPPAATRLLDVGGGHGVFSIMMCREYPNLKATVIDSPAALEVAAGHIATHDMVDRVSLLPGNMWQLDWGTDYDAVLLFNLLHHFDEATNSRLLNRARKALKPGGTVAILDQFTGKVPGSATKAIIRLVGLMYHVFADGRVFEHDNLVTLLEGAGFNDIRFHGLPKLPGNSLMTARRT